MKIREGRLAGFNADCDDFYICGAGHAGKLAINHARRDAINYAHTFARRAACAGGYSDTEMPKEHKAAVKEYAKEFTQIYYRQYLQEYAAAYARAYPREFNREMAELLRAGDEECID